MDLIVTVLSVIITASVTLGYFYTKYAFSFWERNNVKYIKPIFPFGNFTQIFLAQKSFSEFMRNLYESTSDNFFGVYALLRPILIVRNPELCRNILVKDFQYFHDRGLYVNEKHDPLSGHLFALNGERWKNLRAKLTPTFTSGRLKEMFQTLIDCGVGLEKYLNIAANTGSEVEMRDLMARYTTNVIASVAFGIEIDSISEPNVPFRHLGKKLLAPTLKNSMRFALSFMIPKLAELIKLKTVDSEYEKFILSVVKQSIVKREKYGIQRKDFIQLLLQLRNTGKVDYNEDWNFTSSKEKKSNTPRGQYYSFYTQDFSQISDDSKKLSINEFAAQVHVFFIAGFETSATTMSFCLYELAKNPQILQKVQQEIDQVLEKYQGKWSYDAIKEMKYLECCVDEALRMYPPVAVLFRECTVDYKIPGTDTIIKKGTEIFIPAIGLHYDSTFYKNPTTFQPERFIERSKNNNSLTYLPFGDGPRNCIGSRLGMMQAKIGLANIISKFNLHLGDKLQGGKLKYAPEGFVPTPIGGLELRVSHRKIYK